LLEGLTLYPDRGTRLINNYPPLSFYIVAGLAKLTGSVLVAGRLLAWAGYLGCAVLIGLILRRMRCSGSGALLGGAFFAAVIAIRCDLYVGMFDPQLPAQAVMLTGLLVLLGARRRDAVLAAALMVAGGFIKHSLIALPISVTIWLALYHRRLLLAWVLAGALFAGAGLAACMAAFGPEFAAGLSAPRYLDVGSGVRKVLRWLSPIQLPCILALLPPLLGGAEAALVGIYLPVALVTGVIGASPKATNYNMIFELLVAVSLGIGLLAGRFAPRIPSGWVALATAASLVLTAADLATAETLSWRAWSAARRERQAQAQAIVDTLRRTPGPALCGTLLYCVEAGKPFVYDPLNWGMAPGQDQTSLIEDIENRRFSVIQLDNENFYFTPEVQEAIRRAYRATVEQPSLYLPLQ
jgi:hypothetical protein